jgi:hypothetical protein
MHRPFGQCEKKNKIFCMETYIHLRKYMKQVKASNRNEYQEYFLGGKGGRFLGLKTLPPSCADCLESWEPKSPETLRACTRIAFLLLSM